MYTGQRFSLRFLVYQDKMTLLWEPVIPCICPSPEEIQDLEDKSSKGPEPPPNSLIYERLRMTLKPIKEALLRQRMKEKIPPIIIGATPIPLKQKDDKENKFEVKVTQGPSVTADGRLTMIVKILKKEKKILKKEKKILKKENITDDDIASLEGKRIELALGNISLCAATIIDIDHVNMGENVKVPIELLDGKNKEQLKEERYVELDENDFTFYIIDSQVAE